MTHCKQVSVLSHMHLQQAEEVKAQSQEIWHLLALVEQQQVAIEKLAITRGPIQEPRASTSHSESWFYVILGTVNTRRGIAVASYSLVMTPVVNKTSFEDMLAEKANFTPSHQSRHVKFMDMVKGGLTSTPHNQEVALPTRPAYQSHPEEIWLNASTHEFRKMQEPKISKLKGGYTLSAGLVFQSWLKDICFHVQDQRLSQREAI